MDRAAQHGGRRGVVLAAAATVVLVLLAGILLTLGLRSSGPPQPPAADAAPASPAPAATATATAPPHELGTVDPLAWPRRRRRPPPRPGPGRSTSARSCPAHHRCGSTSPRSASTPPRSSTSGAVVTAASRCPSDFAAAGFYTPGPTPGQFGPAVIAGHVDSHRGPAVFYRLGALKAGATVSVGRRDGTTARFVVDKVAAYPKAQFPTAAGLRQHHQPGRAAADHLRRVVRRPQRALRRQRGRVRPPGLRHLTTGARVHQPGGCTGRAGAGNTKGPRPADSAQRVGGPGALVVRRTATGPLGPWPPQGQSPWCGAVWRQATVAVGAGTTPACPSSWRTSVSR